MLVAAPDAWAQADERPWISVAKKNTITTPRWTGVIGNNTVLEARGSLAFLSLIATTPNNSNT